MSDTRDSETMRDGPESRSPGAELKNAREHKGLSLAAVSESTGIPRQVLEALEADDWERLDAPVYVRGYLRKYARLLEIDAERLVSDYESSAVPTDPEIHSYVSEHLPVQRNVRWLLPVTALIVLAILVLAGLWSWHHFNNRALRVQQPTSAVSAMMALTNAGAAHTAAAPSRAAASAGRGVAAPPAGSGTAASAQAVHLQMQVLKPSWVEVYGPGGKRLYYNLAAAGTQLDFHADGDINLFLGNASGVNLKVNGNDYPIPAADISGNTARFSIHAGAQQSPPGGTAP